MSADFGPTGPRIKLGIVANEFFDREVGRMGGFGWAAARVARCFGEDPALGVDVVFLPGEVSAAESGAERIAHGTRLLGVGAASEYAKRVRRERLDLILLIDFRPGYQHAIWARPRTPVILWARDPRTFEDVARVSTLEIPGASGIQPQGISALDCTSFARVVRRAWWWRRRRVLVATTTPYLHAKVPGTYGVEPRAIFTLPNIIDIPSEPVEKSASPTVVFLGRLDPVKRPWIAIELARRFPEVTFLFLGHSHFRGPGTWSPIDVPSNVKLLGHTDSVEKEAVLSSAWVLVNTSIHESLAVSFLEALAWKTPILSCQDPEGVASRFGVYVGRWDGTGLEGLPAFSDGLRLLLDNTALRERLGGDGRQWVAATHSRSRFLGAFAELCRRTGLRPRFGAAVRA